MPNVLDAGGRDALRRRLATLEEAQPARWGRMDVNQMVCHIGDTMRVAMGEIPAEDVSNFFTRTLLKRMVLAGFSPPKEKIKTFPELDQATGGGTKPTTLPEDVAAFEALADRFAAHSSEGGELARNPIFGKLDAREWGRLTYVHADYHLKQFGA